MIAALFFIDALIIRMPINDVLAHVLLALAVLLLCAALFAAKMLGEAMQNLPPLFSCGLA